MKWLICGTRKEGYKEFVFANLDELSMLHGKPELILEGCCLDSADAYAEKWANKQQIVNQHFPSTSGNYLKRNIEMLSKLTNKDLVIAFWDGFSYGTAHTIAWAYIKELRVVIRNLKDIEAKLKELRSEGK